MAKQTVFLDANIIIEAFRIEVWKELAHGWQLETVAKCSEEALTGDTSRAGRVQVDAAQLQAGLHHVHPVSRAERNKLLANYPSCANLDDGEKDLFAFLNARRPLPSVLLVSTADKGAIVRLHELGWIDHLTSLEELLRKTTATNLKVAALGDAYSLRFLSRVRTDVLMGVIP